MPGNLANLGAVALTVAGLIGILRRKRAPAADPVADKRAAAAMEMERRMASYLAARGDQGAGPEHDEQRKR